MPATRPKPRALEGRFIRLEPLDRDHVDELYRAINLPEVFAGGYGGGPAGLQPSAEAFAAWAQTAFRWDSGNVYGIRIVGGESDGVLVGTSTLGDFELEIDWKIGEAGNSGIFYRGTEEYEHIYWSAPEYQLLDDAKAADNKTRLTCAGAAYALYPSPAGHLKPVGDWNTARIVARGTHIEHWLNGVKLVEYELQSADWEAKVKASKFGAWPNYGRAKRGRIALQGDHEGSLAFRNIRIRELK